MMEKLKALGFFKYGLEIPGLMINGQPAPYPVLNERAIRAGAGMMFATGFFAFFHAFYLRDFSFIKIVVVIFFIDFLMKVIVGTKFSPVSALANLIVSKQKPDYVGAIQKRFAWGLGFVLSSTMMFIIYGLGIQGVPTLAICLICLTFMFMESAFGICVGCKIYNFLLRKGILKQPEFKPACPGNVCAIE